METAERRQAWSSFLFDEARELHHRDGVANRTVHLGRLCADLGVTLTHRSDIDRFSAYLLRTEDSWRTATIVLSDAMDGSGYERFCIAHEIGHLLLLRAGSEKPLSTGEHWDLEEICDEFARRLLVPDQLVTVHLGEREPVGLAQSTLTLSFAAKVPWIHAARRVADNVPDAHFFRVMQEANRLRIVSTTLPRRRETGRFFEPGDPVGIVLREVLSSDSGDPMYIGADVLGDTGVPSLVESSEAAVARFGLNRPDLHLTALY